MPKLPILILHGWNLSAEKFRPLQRELEKQRYKVYGMDLPGFGKAVMPKKPLFLSDYVTFVASYLKSKKIDRAVIIGHSFGGRVAIKLEIGRASCRERV